MGTPADDVSLYLRDHETAMRERLAELVEQNSFTDNAEGGRKVLAMLEETFAMPGLAGKRVPSTRFSDHLVLSTEGKKGAPPIALVGHYDTVFPPGTFEGIRRDGELLRGPGVLDMKGGLVVVAYALRAVAETVGLDAIAPLRVVVVADEEVGSPEGQGVIREAIRDASSCLVFEAGRKGDLVITRRKGTGGMTATAFGKAAHAGNAHKEGANAIWALARFVDRVQALTDYSRGVTVNVGKLVGGQGKNTVPDEARCEVDLRFETREDGEALEAAIRAAAAQAAESVQGTRIELGGGIGRLPLERSASSVALMESYLEAARSVGLGSGEAPLIGGGSDASTSSAMGIASIDGLGPRGIGFHTKDEQIEVATLLLKAQALARFLVARSRG
ncbi:MAG: M20/M25/M40 family metallo-hydrolase [Myxococcales bacterium]|nr:M20/M25/M40 family metallo-hydrolase [Myxococcales bacterium]